jgi:hypothetical protein
LAELKILDYEELFSSAEVEGKSISVLKKQANLRQTLVRYLLLINSRVTAQSQQSDSDDRFQPVVLED